MIREDYLMRLIRQFVEALARMVRLREKGDLSGAREAADQLYDSLGIPRELVDVVDAPTLASMLRSPDKIRAGARLLWEEGRILEAGGDPLTAHARYRRARELFVIARDLEPTEDDEAAILELSRAAPAHLEADR
jgi:hypothetical protein